MAKKRPYGLVELKKTIKNPDGSKERKSFYGKNLKIAKQNYDNYLRSIDIFYEESKPKSFKDIADTWLAIKEKSVSDKTYQGYKTKVIQFEEYFKNRNISSITSSELKLYLSIHSHESINTVKKRRIYLNSIFELALDDEYIKKNPMKKVALPECKSADEAQAYEKSEARIIVNLAKEHGIYGLSAFIPLKTGMRPGEVMAFNPSRDFDSDRQIVTVHETVKVKNGKEITGTPKYKSVRSIPVDSEFCEHMANFNFPGYVFANAKNPNKPMRISKWYIYRYNKFMNLLPEYLPKLNAHDLRHTYGTLLYESGTDLYSIAKVMGHKDVKVTQIYVHQRMDALKDKIKLDF